MRYVSVCTETGSLCCQNKTNAHGPIPDGQEMQTHHKSKWPPKKNAGGWKEFFSEYYDETSYSSWKRLSLNKYIKIIDHVGLF